MTTLLHIDASARRDGSVSRDVAQTAVNAWLEANPGGTVVRRDLTRDQIAHFDETALAARSVPADQLSGEALAAAELTWQLADELLAADTVVVSFGLYNWSVPSTLKAWVDRLPVMALQADEHGNGPLAGRRAIIVVASGGAYSEGTPKFGWDHATPWLQQLFGEVLGFDVDVIRAELTLAGVVPALDHLKDHAAALRTAAHEAAATHGAREVVAA